MQDAPTHSANRAAAVETEVTEVAVPSEPKPGYLTTEFIGKCAVQGIAILVLCGVIQTGDQSQANEIALGLIGAVEAAYNFSRGIAKARR